MTKATGFDTLRVLAMRIAPGQEHMEPHYEALGKRHWYSDDGKHPDQVFVIGGGMNRLLQLATPPTSRYGDCSNHWEFESRGLADRFVTLLNTIDGISFWQLGHSRQYAMRNEAPLYGYFQEASFQDHTSRDMLETEYARVEAWKLFEDFMSERDISVVILNAQAMVATSPTLPEGSKPIMILDDEKSEIDKGPEGLVYKPAERQGVIDKPDGPDLFYCLFQNHAEAQSYFARAALGGVGRGWHFGYRR